MSETEPAQAGKKPGGAVHFQYNVDLSNPTAQSLDAVKNDLVQKIANNVARELRELHAIHPTLESEHDRHYSIHGSGGSS